MIEGLRSRDLREKVNFYFITYVGEPNFETAALVAIRYDNYSRTRKAEGLVSLLDNSPAASEEPSTLDLII